MGWLSKTAWLNRIGHFKRRLRLKYITSAIHATMFPADLVNSKREFVLVYLIRLFANVGRRLWHDAMPHHAAALSFQTLLGLVPLFAVALALAYSLGFSWQTYSAEITSFLETHLLPEAARDMGDQIRRIINSIKPVPLGSIAIVTLFALTLTLFNSVETALNAIFRCPKQHNFFARIIRALATLILTPPAIGASLFLTRSVIALPGPLSFLWPLLFSTGALFISYTLLPRRKVKIRYALVAAFVGGILFEALKLSFALYAGRIGSTFSIVYGAFSIVPLFLVWLYTAWMAFLFGAELSAALHEVADKEILTRRNP